LGRYQSAISTRRREGCTEFRLLKVGAFRQWFSNEQVLVGKTTRPIGEVWLNHPHRRQYQGIEFAPVGNRDGYYNLWRGFSVAPRAGSCKKFLDHLHDNVAQGDEYLFRWVVGWFAQIVQQPAEKIGTSLGLRGKQGAGKTIVGRVIGSLFPDHYRLVADPRYVTGRFNAHMVNLLLLQADEAFFAGDKREQGKLKDLVTGEEHPIEFKGIETIWVKNHIRLMATSNEDFVVPAGFDERRFALLDVRNAHAQDHDYFSAIVNEQDNGGREALLHHLQNFDSELVNLREIPKTTALLEQKIKTMTPEQAWWFETLKRGVLPWGIDEPNTCSTRKLFSRYVRHADIQGARRKSIETTIGTFLHRSVGPDLTVIQKKQYNLRDRFGREFTDTGQAYVFPPLRECRKRFANQIGQEVIWGDDADWRHEPKVAEDEDEFL
jgi:hypothetical protein